MSRHAAAVALALSLVPSWLWAQTAERFTIKAASATIHKGPSTGSPVIGRASRGAVLEVTRELGSWVKVSWPQAESGVGYVHVSMGFLGGRSEDNTSYLRQSVRSVARSVTPATPSPLTPPPAETRVVPERPAGSRYTYVLPPHTVGLGARMDGSMIGFGATARAWSRKRLGVQFELSRSSETSPIVPERLTTFDFAPSAVYSLRDRVSDYIWLRPYFGGGASILRATLSAAPGVAGASTTDTSLGFQTFGGGELTFPSVARFAISADVRYRWARAPFSGFEAGGLGFSVSGHWYVK